MLVSGIDGHVHTSLCNHASGEMKEFVESAVAAGLHTIIFLEHLEAGIVYDERTWLEHEHFSLYFSRGKELQEAYSDRIRIKLGVEIGYNPLAVPQLQAVLDAFPFEWRGLSYHFFWDGHRHHNMVSRRQENIKQLTALGLDRIVHAYLDGLLAGIDALRCDVLCHLDAVLRHCPGLRFTEDHRAKFDMILEHMADKGMHLECNTSGFAIRGACFPAQPLIERATALGIPLLPGSDAHRPEQVARFFDKLPFLTSLQYIPTSSAAGSGH